MENPVQVAWIVLEARVVLFQLTQAQVSIVWKGNDSTSPEIVNISLLKIMSYK